MHIRNSRFFDVFVQCSCTTANLVRTFDLKIRYIILKYQELSENVHNSLYFLSRARNRPNVSKPRVLSIFIKYTKISATALARRVCVWTDN